MTYVDSIVRDHSFLVWYMNKLLMDNMPVELHNKKFSDNSVYQYLKNRLVNINTQHKMDLISEYNNMYNTVKC
jgi:hypothetical protein